MCVWLCVCVCVCVLVVVYDGLKTMRKRGRASNESRILVDEGNEVTGGCLGGNEGVSLCVGVDVCVGCGARRTRVCKNSVPV